MQQIVNGKLYDTEKATLVAASGWNYGHQIRLYRTEDGEYFALYLSQWEGDRDVIEPLPIDEAKAFYARLSSQMDCCEAFGEAPV
jgi:hypothetical protein